MDSIAALFTEICGADSCKTGITIVLSLVPLIIAFLGFPHLVAKGDDKHWLLDKFVSPYLFVVSLFPQWRAKANFLKHQKQINAFKLSFDANFDTRKHKLYHSFDDEIYVKPDVKKIDSNSLNSEHHMMSGRTDTDVLRNHRHSLENMLRELENLTTGPLIIRGAAGFGKSNLCSYIAHSINKDAASGFELVFSINAADISAFFDDGGKLDAMDAMLFSRERYRIPAIVSYSIKQKGRARHLESSHICPWQWVLKQQKKRCLLIVDGLDEVGDPTKRNQLMALLQGNKYIKKWSLIVSGRPSSFRGWKSAPNQEAVFYEILPFMEKQINLLAINLYKLIYELEDEVTKTLNSIEKSQDFIRRISSNTTLEMACNPLLLTMMVQLDCLGSKLPDNKPDLIEAVITHILELRSKHLKSSSTEALTFQLKELLVEMAYLSITKQSNSDIRSTLREKLNKFNILKLTDYYSLIEFLDNTGIIHCDEKMRYSFVNRCYSEYLYARHLVDKSTTTTLKEVVFESLKQDYSEVLYYLCAHSRDASEIFDILIDSDDENLKYCIEILSYTKINQKIGINKNLVKKMNDRIRGLKDEKKHLYFELRLLNKLNKLRISDPLLEKGLMFNDFISLASFDRKLHCDDNGFLVGLLPDQIKLVLDLLNKNYADSRGYFSIPHLDTKGTPLDYDELVYIGGDFRVFKSNSDAFYALNSRIKEHTFDLLEQYLDNSTIATPYGKRFLEATKEIVLLIHKYWSPNIFLLQNREKYLQSQSIDYWIQINEDYNLIRDTWFSSPADRAEILRKFDINTFMHGRNNHKVPTGTANGRVFIKSFAGLMGCSTYSLNDLEVLIKECFYSALKSLVSAADTSLFGESILCLCRLLTGSAIAHGAITPWGKVRITFVPSVKINIGKKTHKKTRELQDLVSIE